jgi:chromosome transmission fidelity protein 1
MDFHSLLDFVERSQLLRKLRGFADKTAVQQQDRSTRKTEIGLEDRKAAFAAASSGGYAVAEFVRLLASASADDRVLVCPPDNNNKDLPPELHPTLQFLNLNAEKRFEKVVASARSVILAGGTMEPAAEFLPLFKALPKPPLRFSAGHVVPRENLFVRCVNLSHGVTLDFKHENRAKVPTLQGLSKCVVDVASCTPGGTVLFVASFDYLALWNAALEKAGWKAKLKAAGVDFYTEKRGVSSNELLRDFEKSCESGKAILLAVVGGRLSEGINFANRMCRCVGIVGLPYPNPSDLRLQQKMLFLDSQSGGTSTTPNTPQGLTGREYYRACCMKAVNQSVGRAIRHINDWSAILLIDHRYQQPQIRESISSWVRPSIETASHPNLLAGLRQFYVSHANK